MELKFYKKILAISTIVFFAGFVGVAQANTLTTSIWDELSSILDSTGGSSSFLSNSNPAASQEATNNLSQSNLEIANDEAQALWEVQNADFEACKAEESSGGSSNSGPNNGVTPGDTTRASDSSEVGSGNTLGSNEEKTRQALADKGVAINNANNCGNLTYQEYRSIYGKSCTSVAGMPQSSIDYLGNVSDETGGGVILTGGTEKGHSAHYPGSPAVDIDNTAQTDKYLAEHRTGSSYNVARGTWYQLDDGSKWLDEGDHYHVVTPKSPSKSQLAVVFSSQKNNVLQLATSKVQSIFSWFSKKIKKIGLITVVNASNNVNLGGTTVDPTNISTEELEEIISGLNQSQINSAFSQMSQSALSQLTSRMSFNSLNTVFGNLTSANANTVASTLGGSGFNNIANLLVEESASNIFSNMSVSGFDSLLSGMNNGALESLIGSLDGSGVDNLLLRANDDVLENALNNLGIGGVNNIISGGSEDLLRGVIGNLGSNQLEQIFSSVGLFTADKLIGSLGSDFLNEIIPELDNSALNNLFGNLGSDSLSDLVGSISSGNWEDILGSITGTTANSLIISLGSDGLNSLIPALSDSALGDLFGNLGSDTIAGLADSLTSGNWNTVLGSLGGDVLNETLGSLDIRFGDIISGLDGTTLGNILLNGDSSILNTILSGSSDSILGGALDLVPDNILEQASDIPVVGEFLSGSGLGGLTGLVGGGLYVPVVEQNGQLMTATRNIDSSTQSIDTTTQDIKNLSIQICTHLRAIRRIQTSFETMKIADEANANRTRLEAIAKYANDVAGKDNPDSLVKTGYTKIADGEYVQTQAFPQNLKEHLEETKEESKQVVLADIRSSENLYKDKIAELVDDETSGNLTSTITEEDIQKLKDSGKSSSIKSVATTGFGEKLLAFLPRFISRPISHLAFWKSAQADEATTNSKLSANDFWNIFLKATDPENNPYGSAMLAMQAKEQAQNEAESLARDEYVAAQGILPTGRQCAEEVKDENGKLVACRKWVVVAGKGAPGTVVRETIVEALNSKLKAYLVPGGPESQPEGSAPNAHEAATTGYSVPTSAAAGSGQNNKTGNDGHVQVVDPNSTRSTVQNTQENSGGSATGGFGGNSNDGSGGSGSGSSNEDGGSLNWSNLLSQISSLWNNDDGTSSSGSANILAAINTLLGLAQSTFQSQEPLVQTKVLSPTLAKIRSGQKANQIKLVWATPNSTCEVINDWYGLEEEKIAIVKESGNSLGKTGTQTIVVPKFSTAVLKTKDSANKEAEIAGQIQFETNLFNSKVSFELEKNFVPSSLVMILNEKEIEASGSSWSEIIENLDSNLSLSWPYVQSLNYSENNGTLSLSFKPTYSILCTNSNGEKLIKFNVER